MWEHTKGSEIDWRALPMLSMICRIFLQFKSKLNKYWISWKYFASVFYLHYSNTFQLSGLYECEFCNLWSNFKSSCCTLLIDFATNIITIEASLNLCLQPSQDILVDEKCEQGTKISIVKWWSGDRYGFRQKMLTTNLKQKAESKDLCEVSHKVPLQNITNSSHGTSRIQQQGEN